jgi:Spy/CpxP family protein refolding chaperone
MTTKLMVLVGFCIAFAAGMVVGVNRRTIHPSAASSTHTPPTTSGMRGPGGYLAKELNLTPDQQEQLRQIWSDVARRARGEREELRRQYRKQREEAIAAIIPADQKKQYQQIQDEFTQKMEELDRQWRASFEDAVAKTKPILTPEQRAKYEEMLKRNQWDRSGHDRGDHDHGGRFDHASTRSSDH